jgi:tetratricopeptide (TPR) repeat protein
MTASLKILCALVQLHGCLQKSLSDGKNHSFFENCADFHECRQKIGSTWSSISTGAVDRIADVDRVIIAADQNKTAEYEPIMRQMRLRDGSVTETFPELYEAASKARNIFESYVSELLFRTGIRPQALHVAPLKGLPRATEKANDDYSNRRPGPGLSWLFDVVRASVVCSSEEEILNLVEALRHDTGSAAPAMLIRLKNRFAHPTPGGFRDINANIRIEIGEAEDGSGARLYHTCELQIHFESITTMGKTLRSHGVYDYFRKYFLGSVAAVERRMDLMDQIGTNDGTSSLPHLDLVGMAMQTIADNELHSATVVKLSAWSAILNLMSEIPLDTELHRIILKLKELTCGPENVSVLEECVELADKCNHNGDYDEARTLLNRAKAGYASLLGENCLQALQVDHNIAGLLKDLGQYAEAAETYQRVLNQYEAQLPNPLDWRTLILKHDFAMLKYDMGKYVEARAMFDEVLAGFEVVYGTEHTQTFTAVDNLANLLAKLRDYAAAEECYKRALRGYEKEYGPGSTYTLKVMNNYASMLIEYKSPPASEGGITNLDRAITMLTQALAGYEQTLHSEHTEVLMCVSNLANAYADKRRDDEARTMYERVIAGRTKILGPLHAASIRAELNMGSFLGNIGDFEGSLKSYERVVAAREQVLGPTHLDTLAATYNMGILLTKMGELRQAQPIFERVYAARIELLGPTHVITMQAAERVAINSFNIGLYAKARDHFKIVYEGHLANNNGIETPAAEAIGDRYFGMGCHVINEGRKSDLPLVFEGELHEHALTLKESQYANRHYCCDVCERGGFGWVYHCDVCGYDAHPQCCFNKEGASLFIRFPDPL